MSYLLSCLLVSKRTWIEPSSLVSAKLGTIVGWAWWWYRRWWSEYLVCFPKCGGGRWSPRWAYGWNWTCGHSETLVSLIHIRMLSSFLLWNDLACPPPQCPLLNVILSNWIVRYSKAIINKCKGLSELEELNELLEEANVFSNPYTTDNIQSLRALWLALRDLYATRVESLEGQIHIEKVVFTCFICFAGGPCFGKNVRKKHCRSIPLLIDVKCCYI